MINTSHGKSVGKYHMVIRVNGKTWRGLFQTTLYKGKKVVVPRLKVLPFNQTLACVKV